MKKKIFTALGIMAGTSMDGVDLSLIKSDGDHEFTHILDDYIEFDNDLQKKLINLRSYISNKNDLEKYTKELREIEKQFTLFCGKAINGLLNNNKTKVDLIGFHGQTIFHDQKNKTSKQLGDGSLLSQVTQKVVVNDFRQQDLINGGQGAPLTPIYHKLISKFIVDEHKLTLPINIINIGGITNITQILNDDDVIGNNLIAFDIAPGNCLIDEWVRKNSNKKFDSDGNLARSGNIDFLILNQAIDNFSIRKFDKSLDVKDFDISFVKGLSLEDGCATLTKFSAHLIANGIDFVSKLDKVTPKKNLICGGGRKNSFLIESINDELDQIKVNVENIDEYGFNGDFIESQAFGYLSIRTFLKLPISFPSTTRCKSSTIGGKINKNF